jgi:hypothetical protein
MLAEVWKLLNINRSNRPISIAVLLTLMSMITSSLPHQIGSLTVPVRSLLTSSLDYTEL